MELDKVYCADSLEFLDTISENSVDLIVTDPPYGISMMGKDWDKAVPPVEIWRKCLRVLKPGAFAFVMSAPRQDVLSRMIVNLEDAGFKTNFTSIYWAFPTGFPKGRNMSKAIDQHLGAEREIIDFDKTKYRANRKSEKEGGTRMLAGGFSADNGATITAPATFEAQKFESAYAGFQPKPALEIILVVMKPLSEETHVEQALNNGKGVTWMHYCRIPYKNKDDMLSATPQGKCTSKEIGAIGAEPDAGRNMGRIEFERPELKGRFPSNLLIEGDILDDGIERKSNRCDKPSDCGGNTWGGTIQTNRGPRGYNDSGSFSRYFDLDRWWENKLEELPENIRKTLPFMIVSKVSKSERQKGLSKDVINTHVSVKPVKLLSYLITLGSREGDTVLDPFAGTGTTGMAAIALKRKFMGIEKEQEYADMSNIRLEATKKEMDTSFNYEE